jgi:NADH:ubiquinone oxidoreductase subunit F (NADH-binding)
MTASLVSLLEAAGLTGRGGAAFSTAVKVRAAASEGASLIVHACDGEYGAVKDGYVVAHHLPELVRGAELLGRNSIRYATGRGSRTEATLRSAGLDVLSVPHRYVSSEESALVSLANGGLARPLSKPLPVVFGSVTPDGRRLPPTVVLNAETVWRIAQISERGADWFRSFGPPRNPARDSRRSPVLSPRRASSRPRPACESATSWRWPAELLARSPASAWAA